MANDRRSSLFNGRRPSDKICDLSGARMKSKLDCLPLVRLFSLSNVFDKAIIIKVVNAIYRFLSLTLANSQSKLEPLS